MMAEEQKPTSVLPFRGVMADGGADGAGLQGEVEEASFAFYHELRELISNLNAWGEQGDYGTAYQESLQKLVALAPDQVDTSLVFAAFCAVHGEWREALDFAKSAYRRRKLNPAIWRLLLRCHQTLGEESEALKYRIRLSKEGMDYAKVFSADDLKVRRELFLCRFIPAFAPPFVSKPRMVDGVLTFRGEPLLGEPLPYGQETGEEQDFPYYAGLLNEEENFGLHGKIISWIMEKGAQDHIGFFNSFWFDFLRAVEVDEVEISAEDVPCILPVMGKDMGQTIRMEMAGKKLGIGIIPLETRLLRIEKPCRMKAKDTFLMGRPVKLGHSPKRKKVVLNIFADGLSWAEQKIEGYRNVPNILRFFSQGVIFDNCWSVAEYTYPSLPTIETGLHIHKSQIFHRDFAVRLESDYRTLSEEMRDLGYYSVSLMGDGEGVVNGATRGFERMLVNLGVKHQASQGVVRVMKHLAAFRETDNFIELHLIDSHPCGDSAALPENIQAQFPPEAFCGQEGKASVFLAATPAMRATNQWKIRMLDRELGLLFTYLEENYAPEEYIVHLYSDHGASVYDDDWLLADTHVGAALMARGDGVPHLGRVTELASVLDLYKIMGKTCGFRADALHLDGNLPEAFGGKKREYVISNSIYPGQTYKLAIRTEAHEFRMETAAHTAFDGTVDMSQFRYQIFLRGDDPRQVFSADLAQYFLRIAEQHTRPFWHL